MKQLYFILLFLVLSMGFVTVSHEVWSNSPSTENLTKNASPKILKIKLHPPTGLLQHIYSVRLLAKQNSLLAFNANADRYADGYYIYALAHILI